LKYLGEVKAWGALPAAAAVLIALAAPAGASASAHAHRRHIEVHQPTVGAGLALGSHGGYKIGIVFEEPDLALLVVHRFDRSRLGVEETRYGAHFHGSIGGRLTADFGPVGSIAVRFRPDGAVHEGRSFKGCEGKPARSESGHWVGKVSLRGEGGYFAISTGSAKGALDRTFRLRCHVKRPLPQQPRESLRERIAPRLGFSFPALLLGTVSSLLAGEREGGRLVEVRAAHATGRGPGAEVEAGAFEYQGVMPVGRFVQILETPPGSLVTTLPGERPATAQLKPGAPFSGEASYLASSSTSHSWTGTLAVHFPGLDQPLTGPEFFSSLCVVSPLVKRLGCENQPPSLQPEEESASAAEGRR
jgi:hypothetical protein